LWKQNEKRDETRTGIVEEERVVGASILDQPMHGPQDVLFRRLAHGVLLVIGENHHVLPLVAEVLHEVSRHVPDIVDTSPELTALVEIVDANQQCFPASRALRVLELKSM
jgi:hypothetical protein